MKANRLLLLYVENFYGLIKPPSANTNNNSTKFKVACKVRIIVSNKLKFNKTIAIIVSRPVSK